MGREKLLIVAAIVILFGVTIAIAMNSGTVESNVLVLNVACSLAWAYAAFVAWKTSSSLGYHPILRAAWLLGVLIPFLNILVFAELYDRCDRKMRSGSKPAP